MTPAFAMQFEAQVVQLQGLKDCLEVELTDVYMDRDRLAELLEQVGWVCVCACVLACVGLACKCHSCSLDRNCLGELLEQVLAWRTYFMLYVRLASSA